MRAAVSLAGAAPRTNAGTEPVPRKPLRRPWRIILIGSAALGVLLGPTVFAPSLRLVWNVSASVPVGLYRIAPVASPRRGELVTVRPSPSLARFMAARRYVEAGALLVKPVAAVSGQRVCRIGTTVTIDGAAVATALATDRVKRPLPVWTGCRRLGANDIFLLAPTMKASFDSRYFGPVVATSIVGNAVPVWTGR